MGIAGERGCGVQTSSMSVSVAAGPLRANWLGSQNPNFPRRARLSVRVHASSEDEWTVKKGAKYATTSGFRRKWLNVGAKSSSAKSTMMESKAEANGDVESEISSEELRAEAKELGLKDYNQLFPLPPIMPVYKIRQDTKYVPPDAWQQKKKIRVPFVHYKLFEAIRDTNYMGKKAPLVLTRSRASVILPFMVGRVIAVHNGRAYKPIKITEPMIGRRLGEFVFTRCMIRQAERWRQVREQKRALLKAGVKEKKKKKGRV